MAHPTRPVVCSSACCSPGAGARPGGRALALVGVAALAIAHAAGAQWFVNETTTRFPAQLEYTNQCMVVDVNGDGHLDIVWANGQSYSSLGALLKPRIFINNGTGFFADETDARAAGITGCFRGVEAGDVDGDGDVDLILAQDFNRRPLLLINNGSGFFADETTTRLPNIAMSSARAQFGDVDNDGDLDIVFCNSGTTSRFGTGQPRLFFNNGAGVFTDVTSVALPTGNIAEQMDVLFVDTDNDLDLDIVLATRASSPSQTRHWKNDGSGRFTNQTPFPADATAYSYDAGDIDGDGDLDLIGINAASSNGEQLLRNNGTGTTWAVINTNILPNPTTDDNDSRFFDVDNDGDMDFIVGSLGSRERLYLNNGSGGFTENTTLFPAVSDSTIDIRVADFNSDGRFDVITAQGESGNFQNKIYMNTGGPQDTRAPRVIALEGVTPGPRPAPHVIRANIVDDMTSDRGFHDKGIWLKWRANGGAVQQVAMKWSGNNQWRGVMPAQVGGAAVEYWVEATDWAGNVGTGASAFFTEGGTPPNPADLNGDGVVSGADLGMLLANWGNPGVGDLNGDGVVNGSDLGTLLSAWTV